MARTIFLSAGHATVPRVAGTRANGFKEEELTLELRDLVVPKLRAYGLTVKTDGAHGISATLSDAISIGRKFDIHVELHFNAGSKTSSGPFSLGTLSRKRFGVDLAKAVAKATGLPLHHNGWNSDTLSQHGYLAFCRQGGRGVVLEVCQQSNMEDMRVYLEKKNEVAQAIADMLRHYAESPSRVYDDHLPDEPPVRRVKTKKTSARKRVGRR